MNKENDSTAYGAGRIFYERKIKKLSGELPIFEKEGKIYESVTTAEEIELSQLKLNHLKRRKEKGLMK